MLSVCKMHGSYEYKKAHLSKASGKKFDIIFQERRHIPFLKGFWVWKFLKLVFGSPNACMLFTLESDRIRIWDVKVPTINRRYELCARFRVARGSQRWGSLCWNAQILVSFLLWMWKILTCVGMKNYNEERKRRIGMPHFYLEFWVQC